MEKKYWAVVGRIPDGENSACAFINKMTRKQAVKKFDDIITGGLSKFEKARLKRWHGTAVLHEAVLAADSPIIAYPA